MLVTPVTNLARTRPPGMKLRITGVHLSITPQLVQVIIRLIRCTHLHRPAVKAPLVTYPVSVVTILMGQNLYGYDWTLPFVQGSFARAVSPQQAIQLAANNNVPIQYDTKAQAPFFTYTDQAGKKHEVWFEDARSIQAKFDLIKELQLRGMSYWKLGLSFPQNWLLIMENFDVVKRS